MTVNCLKYNCAFTLAIYTCYQYDYQYHFIFNLQNMANYVYVYSCVKQSKRMNSFHKENRQ